MRGDAWNYRPRRWHESRDLLVQVRPNSFRRFSRRMDRQLVELVERWAHAAAPCALRRRPQTTQEKPKPK